MLQIMNMHHTAGVPTSTIMFFQPRLPSHPPPPSLLATHPTQASPPPAGPAQSLDPQPPLEPPPAWLVYGLPHTHAEVLPACSTRDIPEGGTPVPTPTDRWVDLTCVSGPENEQGEGEPGRSGSPSESRPPSWAESTRPIPSSENHAATQNSAGQPGLAEARDIQSPGSGNGEHRLGVVRSPPRVPAAAVPWAQHLTGQSGDCCSRARQGEKELDRAANGEDCENYLTEDQPAAPTRELLKSSAARKAAACLAFAEMVGKADASGQEPQECGSSKVMLILMVLISAAPAVWLLRPRSRELRSVEVQGPATYRDRYRPLGSGDWGVITTQAQQAGTSYFGFLAILTWNAVLSAVFMRYQ